MREETHAVVAAIIFLNSNPNKPLADRIAASVDVATKIINEIRSVHDEAYASQGLDPSVIFASPGGENGK